ncbi:MAG: tetraacyldisaccharide 4'-kinase [Planctomycetota bacterium]
MSAVLKDDRQAKAPLGGAFGRAFECVYRWELGRRNRRFDAGKGVNRFDVPVISVGNLSVGGTGKTPMVAMVVEELLAIGRRPMIAMRGYAAKPSHHGGDEAMDYEQRFGDRVVVRAQPDRAAAIGEELAKPRPVDCVVLDDGFQHRRVARDLDIVLMDATRPAFGDRCLPAGWLREPVQNLNRSDAVILTRCDLVDEQATSKLERGISQVVASPISIAQSIHTWVNLTDIKTRESRSVDWLRGKRVVVALGIGHPSAFLEQAARTGAVVMNKLIQPDHHHWSIEDEAKLVDLVQQGRADCVLTTTKDGVKLRNGMVDRPAAVIEVEMGIEFRRNGDAIRKLITDTAAGVQSS